MCRTTRGATFPILAKPENDFKGVKKLKNSQKMRFPYISYIKRLLKPYFTKTLWTTPVPHLSRGRTKIFPNL